MSIDRPHKSPQGLLYAFRWAWATRLSAALELFLDQLTARRQSLKDTVLSLAVQSPNREALDREPEDDRLCEQALLVIQREIDNEEFKVDDLARQLALSRSSLYERMKAFGQTPAGLILEHRLRRATLLLESGDRPVGEVAQAVGFKSASHFSQRFRKRFGKTPSEFRRAAGATS